MLIAPNQTLILGAPGCGKTTTLLNRIEHHLEEGTPSHRIAYVSFTKKAVQEAIDRTIARFGGSEVEYPYFRTLHSLCFRKISAENGKIFDSKQKIQFGKFIGVGFSDLGDEAVSGMTIGTSAEDWCLFIENLARNRLVSIEEQYSKELHPPADIHMVRYFAEALKRFKDDNFLLDFTDMLTTFVTNNEHVDVDVAIIDEAQDLSPLQWAVVQVAFKNAKKVYIAGDDDQAIHEWAGADIEKFLALEGEKVVLDQSYRIPHSVWQLSQRIIKPVSKRFEKVFKSREEQGTINRYGMLDMIYPEKLEGSTMWLARHVYMLPKIEAMLKSAGIIFNRRGGNTSVPKGDRDVIYHWEHLRSGHQVSGKAVKDIYAKMESKTRIAHGFKAKVDKDIDVTSLYTMADLKRDWGLLIDAPWFETLNKIGEDNKYYYLAILRKHGTKALMSPPSATINTIHGVKGGEADHVIIMTDVSKRTYESFVNMPDTERRVFYVGVTRAKKHLHIIEATGIYNFLL
jgi:DNA helicase-2/ATP-dependent DNA helicase PcrA